MKKSLYDVIQVEDVRRAEKAVRDLGESASPRRIVAAVLDAVGASVAEREVLAPLWPDAPPLAQLLPKRSEWR